MRSTYLWCLVYGACGSRDKSQPRGVWNGRNAIVSRSHRPQPARSGPKCHPRRHGDDSSVLFVYFLGVKGASTAKVISRLAGTVRVYPHHRIVFIWNTYQTADSPLRLEKASSRHDASYWEILHLILSHFQEIPMRYFHLHHIPDFHNLNGVRYLRRGAVT